MHFTSEHRFDDGIVERDFSLDGIPGILWTPEPASASQPVPLILMGHPGGLLGMRPRLLGRARRSAVDGFATAALELPGGGERPRLPDVDRARADLRRAVGNGRSVDDDIVDRLVLPLVERALPELSSALDALLALPEIRGEAAGYSGGVTAIGIRLAVVEPRIAALGLFAGSFVPRITFEEAQRITIPLHVLLQWDDEGNDRQRALELFDALGSREKTLQANTGGHTGVPGFAGEDAARFFLRHLR